MRTLVVGLIAASLLGSAARGAERSLPLEDVKVLQDGRGSARVAFRMPEIAPGERIAIASAQLRIPLAGATAERRMRLRVYPITRTWSPETASWTTPWSRAGGDVADELYMPVEADLRAGFVVADLTPLVREAVEEGEPMFGFLLTRDPADGIGIPAEDASRFSGLAEAAVAVHYMRVGPRPAAR